MGPEMAPCKGGNWILADSIYARIVDEKYRTLVREDKEVNFNMLRVWGGGIYEQFTLILAMIYACLMNILTSCPGIKGNFYIWCFRGIINA